MLILEQELIYIHRNAVWKFRICDTPSDAEILNLLWYDALSVDE